jgi:hypothetical protein
MWALLSFKVFSVLLSAVMAFWLCAPFWAITITNTAEALTITDAIATHISIRRFALDIWARLRSAVASFSGITDLPDLRLGP